MITMNRQTGKALNKKKFTEAKNKMIELTKMITPDFKTTLNELNQLAKSAQEATWNIKQALENIQAMQSMDSKKDPPETMST